MGNINFTPPTDGSTAEAADVVTPLNTIYNEFNGNIDNANIKSGAAIDGSKLANTSVTDTQMATSASPVTRFSEAGFDFVASGCVWTADAAGSTRLASMTSGVVYIGGVRVTVAAVTSRTFTASKDVYIDVDNTGTITYTDNTTNAASPALAANSIRLGIIIVGASSIANAAAINQGQENRVLPIASSIAYTVTDSLGNLICPRDPNRKLLGYRQIVSNFNSSTVAGVDVTGLSVPVIVPANRKIVITGYGIIFKTGSAGDAVQMNLKESSTTLQTAQYNMAGSNYSTTISPFVPVTPSAGSHTYVLNLTASAAGTMTLQGSSANPAYIKVELA